MKLQIPQEHNPYLIDFCIPTSDSLVMFYYHWIIYQLWEKAITIAF